MKKSTHGKKLDERMAQRVWSTYTEIKLREKGKFSIIQKQQNVPTKLLPTLQFNEPAKRARNSALRKKLLKKRCMKNR